MGAFKFKKFESQKVPGQFDINFVKLLSAHSWAPAQK